MLQAQLYGHCEKRFSIDPVKGVDDKESGYDDSQERRELEKAADMLFGGRWRASQKHSPAFTA